MNTPNGASIEMLFILLYLSGPNSPRYLKGPNGHFYDTYFSKKRDFLSLLKSNIASSSNNALT